MQKILVIEDAHLLRNDLLETLALEGYDVMGAQNGLEGVQIARQYHPDLIVCDIMMPELDGYGVLEELRRDPIMAATPFIFMTAKTDKSDIRFGMGLGADDYLTKPFLTSDLLKSIRARLGKREIVHQQAERKLQELRENILTALPHELRTPLNTIIGFSEMLMSDAPKLEASRVAEWSGHINAAALRLYRLIENYLVYVRLEMMRNDPEKLAAAKSARTADANLLIQFQAAQKAQVFRRVSDLQFDLQDSGEVNISEQDLAKVVDELVDNALKFSEPDTAVQVVSRQTNGQYCIYVTNYGRGMTPEQISSIGAYMQFDRWLYEQQGSGLGLVIVRRIVELVDGSLAIESIPDQQTTVCVKLLSE
jgi:signal transduction histidine kinase